MADSFEIIKLSVPLTLSYSTNQPRTDVPKSEGLEKYREYADKTYTVTMTPIDSEDTNSAWEKASELAKEGWELIGSIPIIGYSYPTIPNPLNYHPRDLSHSFTSGYVLLFKRRIEKA